MSEVAAVPSAPAPWREPPSPRAVLRTAGVAAPEAVSSAQLHDLSRSHSVTFAELPDRSAFVVKRLSPEAHEAGRSLAAELYTYRLASWNAELASVLPEPVHLDERNQVVALVAGRPEHLFAAQCQLPGFPSAGLAAALGRALAALHSATVQLPLPTVAACGVVHLPDADPEDRRVLGGSAGGDELAVAVAADAELAASLRRTAELLQPDCLVHADVKWDNALLLPGPPPRVRLFDWELSGRGDPAWDVGAALADTAALTVRLHGPDALAADPVAWLSPALQALLAAYGRAPGDEFAQRVASCWAARTIHLALECASTLEAPEDPTVQGLLDLARRLADRHDAVSGAVDDALLAAG